VSQHHAEIAVANAGMVPTPAVTQQNDKCQQRQPLRFIHKLPSKGCQAENEDGVRSWTPLSPRRGSSHETATTGAEDAPCAYTAPKTTCIGTSAAALSHQFRAFIETSLLSSRRVAIGQSFQEGHNLVFLFTAESEIARLFSVHGLGMLGAGQQVTFSPASPALHRGIVSRVLSKCTTSRNDFK
jgi:hypothetical protein